MDYINGRNGGLGEFSNAEAVIIGASRACEPRPRVERKEWEPEGEKPFVRCRNCDEERQCVSGRTPEVAVLVARVNLGEPSVKLDNATYHRVPNAVSWRGDRTVTRSERSLAGPCEVYLRLLEVGCGGEVEGSARLQ